MDNLAKDLFLTKHHGLKNDFLVLLDMAKTISLDRTEIVALTDRRIGIGADGLLHALPASPDSPAVAVMVLYNSDGSRAEMSGNGIRCLAQALIDAGAAPVGSFSIETDAGIKEIQGYSDIGDVVAIISVGMGAPVILNTDTRVVGGLEYSATLVDVGNPHLVLVPTQELSAEELLDVDIEKWGRAIESQYPGGMNVEWVLPNKNGKELILRVWERGAGITLACGTGTTASAFVAHSLGLVGNDVVVHNPGGDLEVRVIGSQCFLTGPAQKIADIQVTSRELCQMAALVK